MLKFILTVGVSASGKTTFVNQFMKENENFVNINRDDIRQEVYKEKHNKTFSWSTWRNGLEKNVSEIQTYRINDAILNNKNIIISDTNLDEKTRNKFSKLAKDNNYEFSIIEFDISWEDSISRDKMRDSNLSVGYSVIAKQFEKWYSYKKTKIVQDKTKDKAFIFDIDGTLAHITDRSPYDFSNVKSDIVDETVKNILLSLRLSGYKIVVLSGRKDSCQEDTIDWLNDNGIIYEDLFMRKYDDNRSDDIVKKEIFLQNVLDKYYIVGIFDDRPKVCRMWRSLGLQVLQCGNPYIEF